MNSQHTESSNTGLLQTIVAATVHMWFVPKVSVLIFYLNVHWTYLKLQVIFFKVWPLENNTVVPAVFPTDHSSTGSHFP